MLKRLKEDFARGAQRIRWFATVFSERLKIEIAVIKLLYQSDEMDKKKDELFKSIGRRVYESRTNPDKNIFRDSEVVEALEEIEKIEKNIIELRKKISEIGSADV
jgi:seryl-tRNA synthetase